MKLASIGEFGLIRRLHKILSPQKLPEGALGIGDDASVLPLDGKHRLLLTHDLLLEGVHFLKGSPKDFQAVGWKALAVNLSDIAAMGGRPLQALVGLGLPPAARVEEVEALYRGLGQCARQYLCPILGGDTNSSKGGWVVAVSVMGVCDAPPLLRSGARVGDTLWVTGEVGGAALAWRGRGRLARPEPRLPWGEWLRKSGKVSAAIDLSDGLAGDLVHVSEASRVGFEVELERVPRPAGFAEACRRADLSEAELLLSGGEDYELLFTVRKREEGRFISWAKRRRLRVTRIGRAIAGRKIVFLQNGRPLAKTFPGFRHF